MTDYKMLTKRELTPNPKVPLLGNEISQLKLGISAAVEKLYKAWKDRDKNRRDCLGDGIGEALGVLMTLQGELEEKKGNEHGGK